MSNYQFSPDKVCDLIAKTLPKKAAKQGVSPEMELRSQLGIDSIGLMSIVFTLEEDFGIDLSDFSNRFVAATTVYHIIEIVKDAMEIT